jgi:ribonuclease HI
VVLTYPTNKIVTISYKLKFETTNNTTEYESLILWMKDAKDLGVDEITRFGDSELVVEQVKKVYQVKQPKLRNYVKEFWDMVEQDFSSYNITHVSRKENQLTDSLPIAASTFKTPMNL